MGSSKLRVLIAHHCRLIDLDSTRLKSVVRRIAADHGYDRGEISLLITDDDEIQRLNAKHLQHDWATDVISFLFESDNHLEGEIIVSAETATRMSKDLSWNAADELLLYVIHGMLHLVGYDDLEEELAKEMRREERHYLLEFQVPGADSHAIDSCEKEDTT